MKGDDQNYYPIILYLLFERFPHLNFKNRFYQPLETKPSTQASGPSQAHYTHLFVRIVNSFTLIIIANNFCKKVHHR